MWNEEVFKEYYKADMEKELQKLINQLDRFFAALKYYAHWYSKDKQASLILPRKGGRYSLFCYTCRRWIPNTASPEMKKEGVFASDHFCIRENGKIKIFGEEGIPEEEGLTQLAQRDK